MIITEKLFILYQIAFTISLPKDGSVAIPPGAKHNIKNILHSKK